MAAGITLDDIRTLSHGSAHDAHGNEWLAWPDRSVRVKAYAHHEPCAVFTCDARATVLLTIEHQGERFTRPSCNEHKRCWRLVVRSTSLR